MRLAEGIEVERYERLAVRPLDPETLSMLQHEGLVAPVGNPHLRATAPGMADLAR